MGKNTRKQALRIKQAEKNKERQFYPQGWAVAQLAGWLDKKGLKVKRTSTSNQLLRIEIEGNTLAKTIAERETKDPIYGRKFDGFKHFLLYGFYWKQSDIFVHFAIPE